MYKIRILMLLVMLSHCIQTAAQIHIKGNRYVDFALGTIDGIDPKTQRTNAGQWISISTGKYDKKGNALRFTMDYKQKYYRSYDPKTIPVRTYSTSIGYQFGLVKSVNRFIYLNVIPNIGLVYESINNNISTIGAYEITNQSKFLLMPGCNVEIELGNITLQVRQLWHAKSDIKPFTIQIGVSYRLNR